MKNDYSITFFYYQDIFSVVPFYEKILGLELVLDQGMARIYRIGGQSYFGVVDGNTVDDILNFTACDAFIGTTTESKQIFADANVTLAVTGAAAGQNILILTNSNFASAAALAAATTVFAACDTGNVLIIYANSASENARIAFCALSDSGDVTSATDMAVLIGVTVVEASNGLLVGNFILD